MKKLISICCLFAMVISLSACGFGDGGKNSNREIPVVLQQTLNFENFSQTQTDAISSFVSRNYSTLENKYKSDIIGLTYKGKVYMGLADVNLDGTPEILIGGTSDSAKGLTKLNIFTLDSSNNLKKLLNQKIIVTANEFNPDYRLFDSLYVSEKGEYYFVPTFQSSNGLNSTQSKYISTKLYTVGTNWSIRLIANDSNSDVREDITDNQYPFPCVLQLVDGANIQISVLECLQSYEKEISEFEM